jgi:prophage regulatory protein
MNYYIMGEIIMSRLIRLSEVLHITGLKKSAIYKRIKEGRFPVAVRLGTKHVAWKSNEIQEWIEKRPRVES